MLHSSFYILLVISILISLLSFPHCNILYNLLLFVLNVHMNRIYFRNIFLVLIFQRSFPLVSCLRNFLFLTWIEWCHFLLVLMCIALLDTPSLDLSEIWVDPTKLDLEANLRRSVFSTINSVREKVISILHYFCIMKT